MCFRLKAGSRRCSLQSAIHQVNWEVSLTDLWRNFNPWKMLTLSHFWMESRWFWFCLFSAAQVGDQSAIGMILSSGSQVKWEWTFIFLEGGKESSPETLSLWVDAVANTDSNYVFYWDFEVLPISSNCWTHWYIIFLCSLSRSKVMFQHKFLHLVSSKHIDRI